MTEEDPPQVPRLERLEESQGRRLGDRRVRIVRHEEFRRRHGHLVATDEVLEPAGATGKVLSAVRTFLIGRRIATTEEHTERVGKTTGLAIFASDNISSSAYATEETMRALALAGFGAVALWTLPLTIAIVAVLAVVVTSYLQAIRAYPSGGGSYVVASENLGVLPGLVAGAALLVDYVLTVSVSVAAGVAAVTSALPELFDQRVLIAVGVIALLTVGNLRGIREAGLLFAGPTYFYVVSIIGLILIGFARVALGDVPAPTLPPASFPANGTEILGPFLILRAFASGSVALTGTEAVANGTTAFKKPEARNAGIVLVVMGTLFGTLFLSLSFLATRVGLQPDLSEQQTVLSLLARSLVGDGWYYYVVQAATAVILTLAANTSFSGFPRLASIMATDRFMPRQFAARGDRLAFTTGILALAVVSALLLVVYAGSVTALIPLYTVGVFIAFTLSQAGLVRHWIRERGRGWWTSAVINAIGAFVTGVVAIVVASTKFALGAWMVLAIIPLIVILLLRIHRHYRSIEDELLIQPSRRVHLAARVPRVVVPVSRLDRSALEALSVAKALGGDVTAVHISFDEDGAAAFRTRWTQTVGAEVALDVIVSPYRALMQPLLHYIDALDPSDKRRPVIIVLAEFVPRSWWEAILHNQTALRLKLQLFFRKNTIVMDVPYHLDDPSDFDTD